MDKKDKKRFCELLITTAELFEKDLSTPILNLYFTALENFSIDQVEKALGKVIMLCKFFPKPVEIIELIPGGPGNLADTAQVQADIVVNAIKKIGPYQSVYFSDPVTTAVIQRCFGGWIQICTETMEADLKWFRKDFVSYYQIYFRHNIKSTDKLIGLIEDNNATKGYLDHIPKPVMIDGVDVIKIELKN